MPSKTSFEPFASAWDEMTGEGQRSQSSITDKAFFSLLGDVSGKIIYEPACGNGYLSRMFIKKGAEEVWASDISKSLIAIAKKKSKRITYLVQDTNSIKGIPRDHFDVVIINDGIFYIKDFDIFLKNMHSILKSGGVLMFNAIHPLFSVGRASMQTINNKTAEELVKYSRPYLRDRSEQVDKTWNIKGKKKKVHYWTYKRPISTYINTCIKNHFVISAMREVKTASKIAGKLKQSTIPSHYIIKAAKLT